MDSLKASCVSIVIHLVCYIKIIWKGEILLISICLEAFGKKRKPMNGTNWVPKVHSTLWNVWHHFLLKLINSLNLIYVYLLYYSYNALIFTSCIPMFDILSRSIGGWSPERNEFMLCWVRRVKVTTCLIQFIS